jgi:hypothetical protein
MGESRLASEKSWSTKILLTEKPDNKIGGNEPDTFIVFVKREDKSYLSAPSLP